MPLQPPNPDFLAKAPRPSAKSARPDSGRPDSARPDSGHRSDWRLPAGVTGLVMLMLAMIFGVPEILV